VIFVLSSVPGSAIPDVPWRLTDKVVHVALYAVLGFLIGRALAATTTLAQGSRFLLAAALAAAYGVTDELHQLLTPRRSCDFYDGVADAIGGLLGGLLAATLLARKRTETTPRNSSTKSGNQP
jgi:VanZ family protein